MQKILLLATLVVAGTLALSANNAGQSSTQQQTTASSSSGDTLSGCLKGSKHQYYVVEKDGSRHSLMAKGDQDLSTYVNHMVTVTGKAENRSGAGSDTEGHRKGMFAVDSVSDQGPCKK